MASALANGLAAFIRDLTGNEKGPLLKAALSFTDAELADMAFHYGFTITATEIISTVRDPIDEIVRADALYTYIIALSKVGRLRA